MLPNVAPTVRSPKQRERALTTTILIAVDSFVGNLKRGKWHYLVVHVRPAFGLTRKVDLYVNCERVASMQSPFSYQNAHGGPYQMNIGQRGLRNLAVARWKVIVITCFCISFKFKHIDSSLMKHISVKHTWFLVRQQLNMASWIYAKKTGFHKLLSCCLLHRKCSCLRFAGF